MRRRKKKKSVFSELMTALVVIVFSYTVIGIISVLICVFTMGQGAEEPGKQEVVQNEHVKKEQTKKEQEKKEQTKKEVVKNKTEKVESKYLTEGYWALNQHYVFAIEDENYEGDVYAAGKYHLYIDAVSNDKIPSEWFIFVSKNNYEKLSSLKESECIGNVGGENLSNLTTNFKKGDYVYIISFYSTGDDYMTTGVCEIKKQ